jgi:hypothetical protein
MACDDAVLTTLGNARAYAGSLVGLLERSCARHGWTMAQAAVSRAREVSQRIARILGGGAASTHIGRSALSLAAALCAASFAALAFAPQLVGFAPAPGVVPMQPSARTHDVLGIHGDLYHAAVVPAAWHPQPATAKSAVTHLAAVTTPVSMAVVASHPVHRAAPSVVLAKLDVAHSSNSAAKETADTPQPMLLVFETAEAGTAPVPPTPRADSPGPSPATRTGTGAPTAPAAILAGSTGVLQIRTLQVLEEDDSGWHLHVYHFVVLVPAAAEGSMHSST